MFTGLINDIGEIVAVYSKGGGRLLRIATSYVNADLPIGASIACNGICLTVVTQGEEDLRRWFDVEASLETISCTTLGSWQKGQHINLEKSLRVGDALGGHIVSGHVDGIAEIKSIQKNEDGSIFTFENPKILSQFIAQKGSIALDGTSLTVNRVDNNHFTITLIPHTLAVTTWGAAQSGDKVNIEVDMLARYVARLNDVRNSAGQQGLE